MTFAICHPDKEQQAKGLCRNCYQKTWRDKHKTTFVASCGHTAKKRTKSGKCFKCSKRDYQHYYTLRYRHGITPEEYDQKSVEQGDVCAICKGVNHGRKLSVDHNHLTGENRGLLCVNCNAGIGNFRERADLLYAAVQYLGRWC